MLKKVSGLMLILTLTACPAKPASTNPGGDADPTNSFDQLIVTAEPNEVVQNGIVKLKAAVKGTGSFDPTVNWTVTGSGKLSKTSGLELEYQAPAVLTNDEEIVIEATPKANPNLSKKLTIFLRSKTFVTMYSFEDLDFDGARDSGEVAIADVTFTLKDASGNTVSTTKSDPTGKAVFRDLNPQEYRIEQTVPAGYGSSTSSNTGRLPLTVGPKALTVNFGLTLGEIRGQVYLDKNFDQEREIKLNERGNPETDGQGRVVYKEPGTNAKIELNGTDVSGKAITRTTQTDGEGRFAFNRLPAGTYTITEVQPEELGDWKDSIKPNSKYPLLEVANLTGVSITHDGPSRKDTTTPITLAVGELKGTLFFAESDTPVKGWVFVDQNRNGYDKDIDGRIEDTQGIAGVKLKLSGTAGNTVFPEYGPNFSVNGISDSKGNYIFEAVPTGTYTLEEINPLGYGTGKVRSVIDNNLNFPIAGNTEANIIVSGSENVPPTRPVYFADTLSSISGQVFLDDINDGILNGLDVGLILNVPVTLTGTDLAGNVVNRTARINIYGNFVFNDVLAGEYTLEIKEETPGYNRGKAAAGFIGGNKAGVVSGNSISKIVIPVDSDGTGYTFGYLKP
jgi:large repetitive protein